MSERPEMRLHIFAYHVSQLALTPPGEFGLHPCDGVDAQVVITKGKRHNEPVWDVVERCDVTINGKACGNRQGAIKEFTNMVKEVDPVVI